MVSRDGRSLPAGVDIAALLARGLLQGERFGRNIAIFDCDLRAQAGLLAGGHYPGEAASHRHPGQNDIQLRDPGRFRLRNGCQIRGRKNDQKALGATFHRSADAKAGATLLDLAQSRSWR
jgi:hypothetical protein